MLRSDWTLAASGAAYISIDMSSFAIRMVRAAKLDLSLYEEVEADKQAMGKPWEWLFRTVWQPVWGVSVRREFAGCCLEPLLPLPAGLSGR